MKKGIWLAVSLGAIVLVIGFLVYAFANPGSNQRWAIWFPSSEMKSLRVLEGSLGLPKPVTRVEDDRGCFENSKQTHYCEHRIGLEFQNVGIYGQLRQKLLAEGWTERNLASNGETDNFGFYKGSDGSKYCVEGDRLPIGSPMPPLYVSIEGPTDDRCRALGQPRNY